VAEGRRAEFRHFAAFSDPVAREQIPDPQAPSTFFASRLSWDERLTEPHASMLRLHQALLTLRRREPTLRRSARFHVAALDDATIAIRRDGPHDAFLLVARLKGAGVVDLPHGGFSERSSHSDAVAGPWALVLTSEDPQFTQDPSQPDVDWTADRSLIRFLRPSAVIFKVERER
jgi:maltooligosyltrehalose trehalohydrolase